VRGYGGEGQLPARCATQVTEKRETWVKKNMIEQHIQDYWHFGKVKENEKAER